MARKFGANIETIAEFVEEVHKVLKDRPIYYPDHIGGHCPIPSTEILRSVYPAKLFEFIIKSNEKREKEVQQESSSSILKELKIWHIDMSR